jgi:hypothetical protein
VSEARCFIFTTRRYTSPVRSGAGWGLQNWKEESTGDTVQIGRLVTFLFGCVKGKLVGKQYETSEDLVSRVRNIIEGIRPDVLKIVFESWKGR